MRWLWRIFLLTLITACPNVNAFWHGANVVVENLVSDFGAHCNGDVVNTTATLSITSGTKALTSTTSLWVAGDVNKFIAVAGAGSGAGVLVSKIDAVVSGTQVTLHDNAGTTLTASSQKLGWGTDDTPAFQALNDWAFANQATVAANKIQVVFPTSGTCQWLSNVNSQFNRSFNSFAIGFKNLQIVGNGARITNYTNTTNFLQGPTFFLGSNGVFFDNLHDGRISTVAAGSSSVTLTNAGTPCSPTCQSLFSTGNYALVTGVDLQGFGDPPNPVFFEYVKITNVSGATISLSAPLVNAYESTWPLWNAGDPNHSDNGGPGTIYALSPYWDASFEYDNLTIDQVAQTISNGRSVTYSSVTFSGASCGIPSQNQVYTLINADYSACNAIGNGIEADKIIDNFTISGGTFYGLDFQSGSVNTFTASNVTFTNDIEGLPKAFVGTNVTIPRLKLGPTSYGSATSFNCTNCAITTLVDSNNHTALPSCTMTSGVMSCTASNPQPWAVPKGYIFWRDIYEAEGIFRITDIGQSGSTQTITTSLVGGFPTLPTDVTGLTAFNHPAPQFTCSGCTGDFQIVSMSHAPAGAPLFSKQTFTYTGAVGAAVQPNFSMWGNLVTVSINVTNAYTGAGPLTFCLSQFNNWPVIISNGTVVNFAPCVNAKVAGNRVMTLSGVTCNGSAGTCDAGDTGWTVPDAVKTWFPDKSNSGPIFSADVSASCPGAGCPSITVTMQTDQGIVLP